MRLLLAALLTLSTFPLFAAPDDPLVTLRPGHPRLILTNEALAAAVTAAKTDPLRAQLHARIIALAEAELGASPIKHVLVGPRLLDQSRKAVSRVLLCSLAYRLTGDPRFSARATREMLTAAAFPDWNPSHFLDVAEMSFALAIGYDWLHAQLAPADRAAIKTALLQHGLALAPDAYAPTGAKDKRVSRWVTAHHNWNQVCNGGLLAAALALADEEPALARTVIAGIRRSLPLAMASYAPDGAYPEGPGYWGYGTSFNVIAITLLETALGTDYGLAAQPAFDRTALYRLHIQGTSGLAFNHADGGASIGAQAEYTWLAHRFNLPTALGHSRTLLTSALAGKRLPRSGDRLFALHAAWFPSPPDASPQPSPSILASAPLDVRFRGPAELALFRSAWDDPRALFVGLKAGGNGVNHSHLDLGAFVLDADGVRWAQDLGPDDYNLPAYFGAKRWTYYRLNNTSHNTLTPGDSLQAPKAVAPIIAFKSTPARAFAVADLTPAYPQAARRLLRGIALLDRSRVLVQDDATGLRPGTPLHWRLLTGAKVTLHDARHATLTLDGRTLQVELLAPTNGRFTTAPARPGSSAEKQNDGITVLAATAIPDTADARLAVLLAPVGDHWPARPDAPMLTPLTEWK
jgi:hypothetical protein